MQLVVHLMANIKNAFHPSIFYHTRSRIVCVCMCRRLYGAFHSFYIFYLYALECGFISSSATKCASQFRCTTFLLSKNFHIRIRIYFKSPEFNVQPFFIWILNVATNCFAAYNNCSSANRMRCIRINGCLFASYQFDSHTENAK